MTPMSFWLALVILAAPQADGAASGQGVAARINNEFVTWKEVDNRLKLPSGEITPDMRKAKLRDMAEEMLFLQAAEKNRIEVTEQEVDSQIQREMKSFSNEEDYEKWLRVKGLTKTENRENWRRLILINRLYYHLVQQSYLNPGGDAPGPGYFRFSIA